MHRAVAATAAVGVLAASVVAAANSSVDLGRARAEYDGGRYEATVKILYSLLYIEKAPLRADEELEAHKLLGTSYFFLDDKVKAQREFEEMFEVDPDFEMDDAIEDPAVVVFFNKIRRENAPRRKQIRKQQALAEAMKLAPIREIYVEIQDPKQWLNWVPFGVGQFKNDDNLKGVFFLGVQGGLAGTSLFFYLAQVVKYGGPLFADRPSSDDEIQTIETMQNIQLGTGVLFYIFYAWGVYDAFTNTPPTAFRKKRGEKLIDPPVAPPAEAGSKSSLVPLFVPYFTADAAVGVTWTWEF